MGAHLVEVEGKVKFQSDKFPCNGRIVEPYTAWTVTFSAWSRARVEDDGVLVLDGTDPSVKIAGNTSR